MNRIHSIIIFFLFSFLLFTPSVQAAITPDSRVKTMIDQITQTDLWNEIGGLTGITPITVGGSPYTLNTRYTYSGTPITKATQYFYERCLAAGYSASYHYWSGSIRNVVCEKQGKTKASEIIIVGAHIDGIPSNGPAADDDATGTIAILRALELMAPYNFERTVRFVAFTGEEQTVLGSTAYANSVRSQKIIGMIEAEMMGYESDGNPTAVVYTRRTNHPDYLKDKYLSDTFINAISAYHLPLNPVHVPSGMDQSDHGPFWENGIPAMVFSEDFEEDENPYYHSSQDSRDKLNMPYFTNMAKATLATVAHLAIPETTVTPTASPTLTIRDGDVNNDGTVNSADLNALLHNWLAYLTNSFDQYGDSRINTMDFVKVITFFP